MAGFTNVFAACQVHLTQMQTINPPTQISQTWYSEVKQTKVAGCNTPCCSKQPEMCFPMFPQTMSTMLQPRHGTWIDKPGETNMQTMPKRSLPSFNKAQYIASWHQNCDTAGISFSQRGRTRWVFACEITTSAASPEQLLPSEVEKSVVPHLWVFAACQVFLIGMSFWQMEIHWLWMWTDCLWGTKKVKTDGWTTGARMKQGSWREIVWVVSGDLQWRFWCFWGVTVSDPFFVKALKKVVHIIFHARTPWECTCDSHLIAASPEHSLPFGLRRKPRYL